MRIDEDNQKVLKDLRTKRGSVRSAQTAVTNFDSRNQTFNLIEIKHEGLPQIDQHFEDVHTQLVLLHDYMEENEQERSEFEENYFALKSEMLEIINFEKAHNSTIGPSNNYPFNMSL